MQKIKKYKTYADIPAKYKWDLEDILEGKTIQEYIDEYFLLCEEQIKIKDSKYENIENYIQFLKLSEKSILLKNKITNYLSNRLNINLVDNEINAISNDFEQKLQAYDIKLGSELNNLYKNKDKITSWLNDSRLKDIKKDLEFTLKQFDHKLDEKIESYLNDTAISNPSMEELFSILTNVEIKFDDVMSSKGEKFPLTESNRSLLMKNLDETVRKNAYFNYFNGFLKHKDTLTKFLYNHFKKMSVESLYRKYSSTINAILEDDQINENLLSNLFATVIEKSKIFAKFKKYKKMFFEKKFGKKFEKWDSSVDLVKIKNTYSIEEMQQTVLDALNVMPEEYRKLASKAINEKWIDYIETSSKMSGAYSIGETYGINKKYILMNFDGTINSLFTLIHELGHSMHSYYSDKSNSIFRSSYPLFLAEIASIFNELLLSDYLITHAKSDEEKFYLLNQDINNFIGTVLIQTIWANFEYELYNGIDKGKFLNSYLEMEKLYSEVYNRYSHSTKLKLGDKENIYSVTIPHFYYGFYVYKYALGYIIASSFFLDYKMQGSVSLQNYITNFLCSGDRSWPTETLKKCGIDIYKSEVYDKAFKTIDEKIEEYIKLGKKIFFNK
ncbi:oligoendopeptidase F [Metamycoplasma hyosynoviae]|uniref:oligoendopeptidase F n=2 Tax=Metamycoplasma hyosynoviae TaxID=29559 RepID=UPI00235E5385|nr:oligoendopeptidase F [Metamycoplasma hyosynoviae]MDD1373556.1 oligoendopeptidase F [Metamycoplasma hyosynoviae]MDD1375685.1 oligoendopeptidase F [Metamycoplasma hyosynoviae]MDD1376189.1 oligoendopeptidase F [Metamycoplasma hyosynoviae]MDD1376976.1 oligoendopeptidase F [Metamycoplasma hyosynoviae]